MAYDDGYYYGQCKIVCTAVDSSMNGKTVSVIAVDNPTNTKSATITNQKATLLVPGRSLYKVAVLDGSKDIWSKEIEAGYGDCIDVHLANGYDDVKQKDILDLNKIMTESNLDYKTASAAAAKEIVENKLGNCRIYEDANHEFFIVGADSVPKKLGDLQPEIIGFWAYTADLVPGITGSAIIVFDVRDFAKVTFTMEKTTQKVSSLSWRKTGDTKWISITVPASGVEIDISQYDELRMTMSVNSDGEGKSSANLKKIVWSRA